MPTISHSRRQMNEQVRSQEPEQQAHQEQINQDNVDLNSNAVLVQYNAESSENNPQINLLPTDNAAMHRYLLKRRLHLLYPTQRITMYSIIFLVFNVLVIIIEYSYNLPIAKTRSNPYNSLLTTRYIATTSFFNILYAILALISSIDFIIFDLIFLFKLI